MCLDLDKDRKISENALKSLRPKLNAFSGPEAVQPFRVCGYSGAHTHTLQPTTDDGSNSDVRTVSPFVCKS
jgi:hypothetical protein